MLKSMINPDSSGKNTNLVLVSVFALIALAITAVPLWAANYYVRTDGNDGNTGLANTPEGAWLTISHAINTVSSGDVINVAAGTYDEQVVIDKSLTLQGVGNTTIIQPTAITQTYNRKKVSGTESNPTNAIVVATVNVGTPNSITIKDLKIDSEQVTSWGTGSKNVGILYQGAAGIIDNITFTGGASQYDIGDCIYVSAFEETVAVEIKSCDMVTSFYKNGITCNFAGLTANIHDNTVTGAGPIDTIAQNCIQIGFGATGNMTGNAVSNVVFDPDGSGAAGLLVSSSDAIVSGNTITDCQKGIAVQPYDAGSYTVTISNNTISSAGLNGVTWLYNVAGISVAPQNAGATIAVTIENNDLISDGPYCGIEFFGAYGTIDATVTDNEISGWTEAGIGTYPWGDASITVNITGNTFTDNVEEGIATWDCGSSTPPTQIITNNTITGSKWGITSCHTITTAHCNNIYDNTEYGIWNADAVVLDAENNWWGDASGPYHSTNQSATGNPVTDNVDYSPWVDDSVADYVNVATQTQTNIGPSGGQVKVTISVGGDASNYLDVYKVGSLSGLPVTSGEIFPGGFDKRSNIVWGINKTGTVTATLVFDYSQQSGVSNASTIEILKRDDAQDNTWEELTESSRDDIARTITFTGVSSFSEYALGAGSDNSLPVTLSSFNVLFSNGTPTLEWTTQSETNNVGWNIYRSPSQNIGQAILLNPGAIIIGAGTTTEPTEYTYNDMYAVEENKTYWYWIESIDNSGETELYGPVSLTIPFGNDNNGTPVASDNYGLHQNYPNPFNPSTLISFALAEESDVELTIYNIKGEKIKSIFNEHVYADQINTAIWNGTDSSGKQVSSGMYFYILITDTEEYKKKMLMVKQM